MWRKRAWKLTAGLVLTPFLVSSCGIMWVFPEIRKEPWQLVSAHKRLVGVTWAGLRMAYVYMYDSGSMHEKHIKAGRILKKAFIKSGGLYLKFGQIIGSLDIVVPDQYRHELRDLMASCPEDTYETVKSMVEEQTGQPIDRTFSFFDRKAIASASIAQVHRAKLLNGQQVAVKVQHRGLVENTRFDLALLGAFVKVGEHYFQNFRYGWLVQEMSKNLPKQLDFRLEAANIQKIKKFIQKDKINCVVPTVYAPTTQKLLIMEYLDGVHIHDVDKIKTMGINTKKLSADVSRLLSRMIYVYGFVHGDPHSGNIKVRRKLGTKDQGEIVLLDHGLYQQLSPAVKTSYCRLWMGILTQNQNMIFQAAKELKANNPKLFCSMLTSRKYDTIKQDKKMDRLLIKREEMGQLQELAKRQYLNISTILNNMDRQLLLLFKVNDFSRSLENMLGGREARIFLDVAKGCFETLNVTWWRRWLFQLAFYYHNR